MIRNTLNRVLSVLVAFCMLATCGSSDSVDGKQIEPKVKVNARPFPLEQVRLLDGPFKHAQEMNRKYLHDLENDRLLHMFRVTAGLPSSAESMGGWEKKGLRGHFTGGHYLSACALMYASTGDEKLKAKADTLVAELAKCQEALGNGYLGAFPEAGINAVIYQTGGWWAPWYTFHKIMAGMLDMYIHCGNRQALEVATRMAAWAKMRTDDLNTEQMQRMLDVEYGGMNEVLCDLYALTGNLEYLTLARRFDHQKILDPLANRLDRLKGLHSNTTIPKIIGAAREYELTGLERYRDIATFFWNQIVDARSFCTGGTSNGEHWQDEPNRLAKQLGPHTQECCCTYNMLKLTRHLFSWNADARSADYYERALFNGILPTQNPADGMLMYFVPLGAGYFKGFNLPRKSFWCCTGTGVESFAKLGDSIYFHNDAELFVSLFVASELRWAQKNLRLRQETNFPEQEGTTLIFKTDEPRELTLRIRVPYWATGGVKVKINDRPCKVTSQPSSFLALKRSWKDGDRVALEFPMSLHLHTMPDDPSLGAIMYGPLVLAGELGSEGLTRDMVYGHQSVVGKGAHDVDFSPLPAPTFEVKRDDLKSWIRPVPGKPLTFRTSGGKPRDVTLVPYYRLFGQRYAIYWRIGKSPLTQG